jgi:hypothetical protein
MGSTGADVLPHDQPMFGGMSHSTSKPDFQRAEHSTYRMF